MDTAPHKVHVHQRRHRFLSPRHFLALCVLMSLLSILIHGSWCGWFSVPRHPVILVLYGSIAVLLAILADRVIVHHTNDLIVYIAHTYQTTLYTTNRLNTRGFKRFYADHPDTHIREAIRMIDHYSALAILLYGIVTVTGLLIVRCR